ncbi:hypothetical protein [Streptomyces thermodiastaticus]|uniref:hypothetical protein n=1 Tax=Streptomyces thermodiastaticus TaxID=44061 RepID=UPI00199B6D3B|nr:hypothetical protein [Streptomyces thermodiastaticus]MCE7550895.1 hypothetical protein [Streptomyces thermodiastaticus]GHF73996.1 hypothetical protein GCM10018787_23370 [Streptomyces thermodiastaticus]
MPRGGARVVSGPPPDPGSLKQTKLAEKGGWTTLPAEGRQGQTPVWPLVSPAERELDLWERLWAMPQAVMWEAMGQHDEVAMYVRCFVEAERIDGRIDIKKLVRQYADSLGLSTQGMLRNRWKVARATADQAPAAAAAPAPRRRSARDRLKVVPGGEGA